jgi:hypothetical protein
MTAQYQITDDSEFSGAIVYIDGEPYTVADDHPAYDKIVAHLIGKVDDDDALLGLINPAKGAADKLTSLSERVSFAGGTIYFDGDPIVTAIADHIVRIFDQGAEKDWRPLVNFLEKVATNPSRQSREHLYHFIDDNKMTLHEDGDLIAYKGVNPNGTSSHAGYGIVDGKVFGAIDDEGRLVKGEHLPNDVGSVIEIPRSMVDDDRGVACSTGLHVGAYSYASTFASKLLTVKVNPRDVVSVPHDSGNQKVRVSRYLVLAENEGKYFDQPSYFEEHDDDDFTEVVEDDQDAKTAFSTESDSADDAEVPQLSDRDKVILGVVFPLTPQVSEDDSEDEDEEDQALTDAEIRENNWVATFEKLIPQLLEEGESLRRYRSKRVTAKNRPLFEKAATNLGIDL